MVEDQTQQEAATKIVIHYLAILLLYFIIQDENIHRHSNKVKHLIIINGNKWKSK